MAAAAVGDKDDERGNNSDYLILGHVLPHTVAVQLKPAIGKGKAWRRGRLYTIHPNATAKTSVVGEHCPHCQRPLIEIDCYGERLIGCI